MSGEQCGQNLETVCLVEPSLTSPLLAAVCFTPISREQQSHISFSGKSALLDVTVKDFSSKYRRSQLNTNSELALLADNISGMCGCV